MVFIRSGPLSTMSSTFVEDVAAVSGLPPGVFGVRGTANAQPAHFQFTYVPPGATCLAMKTAQCVSGGSGIPRPPRCAFSVSGDHYCPG